MKHNAIQTNLQLGYTFRRSPRAKYRIRTTNAARKHLESQPVSDELAMWAMKKDATVALAVVLGH